MIKSVWFNEQNLTWIKEASDRLGVKQNKLINTMMTHLRESDNGVYFDELCRGYSLNNIKKIDSKAIEHPKTP